MPDVLAYPFLLLMPALVIVAAMKDLTSFTIPNWISAAAILAFIPAALVAGLTPAAVGMHFLTGVLVLLVGMAMFAFGWVGGGDAKLLAAVGLWIGGPAIAPFLIYTALAGGGLTLILLNVRSDAVRAVVPAGPAWVERLREPKGHVPYGVAIAIGALAAFPGSDLGLTLAGMN